MLDWEPKEYYDWNVTPVMLIRSKYGYRVKLKFIDGTESVQQKSGFSSKKEANQARDNTVVELSNRTYIVWNNITVEDFLIFWLQKVMRPNIANSTYESYRIRMKKQIFPRIGEMKLSTLNRDKITKLYKDISLESSSIVKIVKCIMDTSMRYARQMGFLSINPAENVDLPKEVEKKPYHMRKIDTTKTLTLEQILTLIEASKGTKIYMQVLFAVLMGLRKSEINGLKYSDVDFLNQTLSIQRQLGKAPYADDMEYESRTKTKQEIKLKTRSSTRQLGIPDFVFDAILEQRVIYEANKSRRKTVFNDSDYICCSDMGFPRSPQFHYQYYKKLLRDNNLPNISFHALRSTYTTLLMKNDFSLKAISLALGHAKEIITADVYGDTAQVIAGPLKEMQDFANEVIPEPLPIHSSFCSFNICLNQDRSGHSKN